VSSFIVALLLVLIAASGLQPQRPPDNVILAMMVAWSGVAFALLVRSMGWKNSGLFFGVGVIVAFLSEYVGVNVVKVVTHQIYPQLTNIPFAILLGWFVALAAAYAFAAALWKDAGMVFIAIGAGLLATIYDMVADPLGLAQGWWVWNQPGNYALSIVGENGASGIPWSNFVGWFILAGGVSLLYEWLIRKERFYAVRFELKWASLLYFALCLPGLAWALRSGHRSVFNAPLLPLATLGLMTLWKLKTHR
jgi:putative membrane protein